MKSGEALAKRRQAAVPRGWSSAHDVFIDHAANAEVWDVDGTRYIDFASILLDVLEEMGKQCTS